MILLQYYAKIPDLLHEQEDFFQKCPDWRERRLYVHDRSRTVISSTGQASDWHGSNPVQKHHYEFGTKLGMGVSKQRL